MGHFLCNLLICCLKKFVSYESVQYLCIVKLRDYIKGIFARKQYHVLKQGGYYASLDWRIDRMAFGETIYLNIVELLTDIYSEVEWQTDLVTPLFEAWKAFVDVHGKALLEQLFCRDGYAVIAWRMTISDDGATSGYYFWQLKENDYNKVVMGDDIVIVPYDKSINYYVLKSPTYDAIGRGDHELCMPYIKYLDNVLNGSNTISERLGTFIIGVPATPSGASLGGVFNERQKRELELEIQSQYGALASQRQIMVLPNGMEFTTINLAGLDQKTNEKARLAILAICDRIKVPANQVAIIDANASKSLSNGTELREGDLSKYRSFRRLLNATFFDMATEIGLRVNYTIENEPRTVQGQTIEQTFA